MHFEILIGLRHGGHPMNLPSFLYNIVKRQASYVQQGKAQSVSHHCLIREIVEKELTRQHLGTWEDFVKLKPMGPQSSGPRGQGMGTHEKTAVGVRKVVYKTTSEASASAFQPKDVKRKVPPTNAFASKKRKVHIAAIEESSKEVSPLSHKIALDSKKGKVVD